MDCTPQGSSVHGILQAILEWVAISLSTDPGIEPMSPALQADSLLTELGGKPLGTDFQPMTGIAILCFL